ncbi:MAG TPA: hypothetical protein VKW06_08345 [Candidatus Angelobacter sp.]|nr:hypothetical protein [Candidatus Angelobacter sp.]
MKTRMMGLIAATAIALISLAAHSQQPAASAAAPNKITPGTMIQVEMSGDVDVKKVHAGDTFKTKLWDDVRAGGQIVLPRKTVIVGHVVEAQPHTKASPESKLTVAFDKALLKDGELPLRGIVERVQFSSIAVSAAADAKEHSYGNSPFPGSTTNVAMPTSGRTQDNDVPPGPTNIRDTTIDAKGDPSAATTVLSSTTKDDVKLRRFATLDVRISQ